MSSNIIFYYKVQTSHNKDAIYARGISMPKMQ